MSIAYSLERLALPSKRDFIKGSAVWPLKDAPTIDETMPARCIVDLQAEAPIEDGCVAGLNRQFTFKVVDAVTLCHMPALTSCVASACLLLFSPISASFSRKYRLTSRLFAEPTRERS